MILLLALALQAPGPKVGEVTDTSAVVWVRRTAPGKVRVRYGTKEDLSDAKATDEADVTDATDFARQFKLTGLEPATVYHFEAECRGRFRTAPRAEQPADVAFVVITGQAYKDLDHPEGFNIYPSMAKLDPDFIVPTGDSVYYDNDPPLATTPALCRLHWQRMYGLPRLVEFHRRIPAYWEKDDHDLLMDDCWPGMKPARVAPLTWEQGLQVFREQVPQPEKPYRTFRWGQHLQVWLTEGRDFRSSNKDPDGPAKTIWGAEQKAWFKKTVLESDATWKVLVSPTPIVGPDRSNKGDNHANAAFRTEGDEIRRWIKDNVPANFFIACGDRHWQYHSVHPETGVHEFSCGPASDKHAGGSPGENKDYHRFHRVKGGFLSVSVTGGALSFRLHDVQGAVVYEHQPRR
jgi:alkaline phosphatase D